MKINSPHRVVALLFMAILLMGKSKCEKPIPPAPNLEGDWHWSCTNTKSENTEESIVELQAALTCAEQTPDVSPFLTYVKEHIRFVKGVNTSAPNNWTAFFAYGTCVDTQEGTYTYIWNKQTLQHELTILDKQGQVSQVYNVSQASGTELKLTNEQKNCQLSKDPAPEVKKGSHPRPLPTTIEWELRLNGGVMLWNSSAQFPFVYQTPQLQSRVSSPTDYRVEYSVLNIKIDGSELAHYAAYVQLYNTKTNSLVGVSTMKELSNGVSFEIQSQEPGTDLQLTGTFLQ